MSFDVRNAFKRWYNVLLIKKKTIQNHPDYLKWVNWLFGIEEQIWDDNHNQSLNYFNLFNLFNLFIYLFN